MTQAEKIAKEKAEYIIQTCLDTSYKFHRGRGEPVMEGILKKLIQQIAEQTRRECQRQIDRELGGIVATHPWMTIPDVRDSCWEYEDAT